MNDGKKKLNNKMSICDVHIVLKDEDENDAHSQAPAGVRSTTYQSHDTSSTTTTRVDADRSFSSKRAWWRPLRKKRAATVQFDRI